MTRSVGFKFTKRVLFVVAVVVAMLLGWGAWVGARSFYLQAVVGSALERDLGFRHGTPYIQSGDSFDEVLTIETVTRGGLCDGAGFRAGDVVRGLSVTELFRLLHESRGGAATLVVVDGGTGPPLDARAERRITVVVPAAR